MCRIHGRGGHYRAEEATRLDSKATSVAFTKGGHTIEKELRGGG